MPVNDQEHVDQLRDDLREAGARFCEAVKELEPLADRLVFLEACLLAAECRGAIKHQGPGVRALATEVLCGRLRALHPDLAYASLPAAERSAEALATPPGSEK